MKILYTSAELLQDQGLLKNIETAGRVCYKSEDRITEDSALTFVNMIRKSGHYSVLEHGSIYLKSKFPIIIEDISTERYISGNALPESPWCHIDLKDSFYYYYTNLRVIEEACPRLADCIIKSKPLPEGIEFFNPSSSDPYRRISFRIIADFKISEQYLRHRLLSPSKESTRFCNYSKEKFNKELSIVLPQSLARILGFLPCSVSSLNDKWKVHFKEETVKSKNAEFYINNILTHFSEKISDTEYLVNLSMYPELDLYLSIAKLAEIKYMDLVNKGTKPEEARIILPCMTKTEQVMTGFIKDWQEVCVKRSIKAAQTEARVIANDISMVLNDLRNSNKEKDLYTVAHEYLDALKADFSYDNV